MILPSIWGLYGIILGFNMILIKHDQDPYLNPSMEVHGELQASVRLKEKLAEMEAAKTSAEERFNTPAILTNDHMCGTFLFQISVFF